MESIATGSLVTLGRQVHYLESEMARIQVYGIINAQPHAPDIFDTELFNLNFEATNWINDKLEKIIAEKKKAIIDIVLVCTKS